MSQTVIDLQLHKKYLDVRGRSNARKTELADALAKALVEDPVTCLKRFPLYELRFLKHSAAYGKGNGVEFNKTSMHLHSLPLGLAVILEPEEDESVYVLIGRAASNLLEEENCFAPRATKDLDIILC